jgi:predicted GIY-YIG superfamily endonuclease
MNKPTHKVTLYRAFNTDDELLYVGISNNFMTRLHQHESRSKWHKLAAKMTLMHFDTRELAEEAELVAIRSEKPLFNKKDNEDWHNSSTHLLKILSYVDSHHKKIVDAQTKIVEAMAKFDHGTSRIALYCYAFQSAIQLVCEADENQVEIPCVSCEKLYYHQLMEDKAIEFAVADSLGVRAGLWGRNEIWEATVEAANK